MDPAAVHALIPILITLIVFGMPVSIVFINKYFKLKNRELDLDHEVQKRWTEDQRRQLEARVASLESGMQAVLQLVAPRVPMSQQGLPPLGPQVTADRLAGVAEPPPDGQVPAQAAVPGLRERG